MTTKEFITALNQKDLSKLDRTHKKALKRKNDINILKNLYYNKYIIKEENIPSYQNRKKIINDQKNSLNKWLDYLLAENNNYSTWIKCWIFQGIIKIGTFDETNNNYLKRSKKTKAPFIELDEEIISKSVDFIEKYIQTHCKKDIFSQTPISFSKIYINFLNEKNNYLRQNENIHDGVWITYHSETEEEVKTKKMNNITPEYLKLYNSLQGYHTGWCTAGSELTAYNQICGKGGYEGGDFHVYYTKDENGNYKIPRIAIRMSHNNIGEIRGIEAGQNIEDGLEIIVQEKIKTFENIKKPNINHYLKIINHMKRLTKLNKKNTYNQEFTKEDIMFIYEIRQKIENFGWEHDPRINRIITKRNHQEDYSKLETTEEKVKFLTTIKDKLIVNDIEESDRKIIEETIKINPYTLSYANKKLTDDKELVMEAITKSGYVISYASERLKKDKEVALTAIKSREGAIRYIDKSLKYNKEFIEEALKVNEFIIFELDEKEQLIHNNIKKLIK